MIVARSYSSVLSTFGEWWLIVLYLAALCMAIPLAASRAQTPQQANPPRPSAEARKGYEERMMSIHPARPGCFEAHFPEERWVEKPCLPAPRTPNQHAQGPHPNNVGDGTDFFATVTSGNISQVTGSFDSVSGVVNLLGPILGDTSVVHPNAYAMQMNSNTFTPSICGTLTNCAWVQFIFSQTQCGSSPCVFIEYWLLNHASPCPTNASWNFYNGSVPGTTPGCFLNTPATSLAAVPLSDLGSLRVVAKTQGGNDIVTISDVNGTLGSASNASIASLASGWTGVEYNLVGDCCSVETFFTDTTTASLTLRVATVNGTTNAPNCASTFSGTTAESNNLNLTGGCAPVSGANPAIVFTESGGGPLPAGVAVGDTHLTTVSGAHYDFQASGDFVLADTGPGFIVQNRQASGAPIWPNAAVNKAVATKMGRTSVAICVAPTRLMIDGRSGTIASGTSRSLPDGVTLSRNGDVFVIKNRNGDSVRAQLNHNAQPLNDWIDVSIGLRTGSEAPKLRGLLGNPNGNVNEIGLADGTVLKEPVSFEVLYQRYGASWRVPPGESLLCKDQKVESGIPAKPFFANDLNREQSERARKICTAAGVKEPSALEDCMLDVTVIGAANAAKVFVHAPTPVAVWQAH
jgi:hypothetical protein